MKNARRWLLGGRHRYILLGQQQHGSQSGDGFLRKKHRVLIMVILAFAAVIGVLAVG